MKESQRESLRLEVGVLHRELEDAFVHRLILCEAAAELFEQAGFFGVTKVTEQLLESGAVPSDRIGRLSGLANIRDGRFAGVRHHRSVPGVGALGELHEHFP